MTFQEAVELAEEQEYTGSDDRNVWYGDAAKGISNWLVEYDENGKAVFVMEVGTHNTWSKD